MKTILKIVLAGVILMILAVGGCAALLGGAASEIDKDMKKDQAEYGMTTDEYTEVKPGIGYNAFVEKYGEPDPEQTQEITVKGVEDVTVYYHVEGGDMLDMYQFSFSNGKLQSKAKF